MRLDAARARVHGLPDDARAFYLEVLSSVPPTRPHVDVAVMEVWPGITENATSTLLGRLRERAGAMGCDAVFLNQVDTHLTEHGAATTLTATCIVYTAPLE